MYAPDWTDAEIEILRARRADRIPVPAIALELGRTVAATYARAAIVGAMVMERREWSAAEEARLRALYEADTPIAEIAEILGRSVTSLRWKLDDLGIGGKRTQYWTTAEDEALKAFVGGRRATEVDFEAAARAVADQTGKPARSATSVAGRAQTLKFCQQTHARWTDGDLDALRLAAAAGTLDAFAEASGRSKVAVTTKAVAEGFIERKATAYTEDELEAIRLAVGADDLAGLAERTGRSFRAMRERAIEEGWMGRRQRRDLDDETRAAIEAAARAGNELISSVAKRLNREIRLVRRVAAEAGLEFPTGLSKPRATRPAVARPAVRAVRPAPVKADVGVGRLLKVAAAATFAAAPVRARKAVRKAAAPRPAPARAVAKPAAPRKAFVNLSTGGRMVEVRPIGDMSDAVARFLAEKGATRSVAGPEEAVIRGLRGRGYSVVGCGGGWKIDARVQLDSFDELSEFAAARGVAVQPAGQRA